MSVNMTNGRLCALHVSIVTGITERGGRGVLGGVLDAGTRLSWMSWMPWGCVLDVLGLCPGCPGYVSWMSWGISWGCHGCPGGDQGI